jgi:hypothetical protein
LSTTFQTYNAWDLTHQKGQKIQKSIKKGKNIIWQKEGVGQVVV